MKYSPERKEAVLKKMMPPHNRPLSQIAAEEGISEATLYNWRRETLVLWTKSECRGFIFCTTKCCSMSKLSPHNCRSRPLCRSQKTLSIPNILSKENPPPTQSKNFRASNSKKGYRTKALYQGLTLKRTGTL